MGAHPIISVILPVYKVEAYLSRCIESIINQSFSDFELILVDDGSPDNSGIICDEYAKSDARIRVIHQKNMKLSAARNAGIDVATGEWIALVDSDDWVHKDYLKTLLSGALEDTDIVIGGCFVTSNKLEDDKSLGEVSFQSASVKDIYTDHLMSTRVWGRLIRRRTISDLRFISGTEPTEDSVFNTLLFREDLQFRFTKEKLYYYYMRPESAIHTSMGRGTLNAIGALLERLEEIKDCEIRRNVIKRCYKYIFSARYGEMFASDYADVKRQCTSLLKKVSVYLPELMTKDRIVMRALSMSPLLYRTWRIVDDPTLLQFERYKREGWQLRMNSMKKVITYGTFDLLHYGHINLLRRAKEFGDYLIVALSTDHFNSVCKNKKCYFSYDQRKLLLESVRYVDLVIPEENWEQKIVDVKEYHIDTFVMGDDWEGKFDFLKDYCEVVYLPRTPEISTTQMKEDLRGLRADE